MSESVTSINIDCTSDEEAENVNHAPVCLHNCETIDVISDDETSSVCTDGTSSVCTDSSIIVDSDNSECEPCMSRPIILENLDPTSSHVTYCNTIENSTDILLGTKAIFNEPVVIQQIHQLIVTGDGLVVNHDQQHLPNNEITENQIQSATINEPKCHRSIPITISSVSLIGVIVVVGYFLYVQITALYAGTLFVCKTNNTVTCYIGSSTIYCSNLDSSDDRPFISGHTTGDICKIYSRKNCRGDIQRIGRNHTIFDFDALSASC